MADHLIEVCAVHRRLGGHDVLAGAELHVDPGETVMLAGVNGAGKSTLLKVLLDLRALDRGTIRIDGHPHTDRRARAGVAYLPERFQPPYFMRGLQYLEHARRLYRAHCGRDEMVATAARLGLAEAELGRPAQDYSKGMAQMLGLAGCLVSGRGLLVLDEPMSGLDPTARRRLQQSLREARAAGRTILFTSHLMQDATALADRVLVLHAGRIVADAAPAELAAEHGGDLEAAFVACVEGEPRPAATS